MRTRNILPVGVGEGKIRISPLSMILLLLTLDHITTKCNAFHPFTSSAPPFSSRRVAPSIRTHRQTTLGATAAPQVLEFREPRTNVTVMLVGAMHYNPASVALAEDTCRKLAESSSLGSVVIESCNIRWEAAKEMKAKMPIVSKLLGNEMRAACDVSEEYGRPVVLGDQLINVTVARLKETFSETASDIISPFGGGWTRFQNDVVKAFRETNPSGDGYIGASGLLDPKLIAGLPISFLKYPASYLTRSPGGTLLFGTFLYLLNSLEQANAAEALTADVSSPAYILSSVASTGFAVLETVFFARLLLVVLLAERNVTLAQSILEQCEIYSGVDAVGGLNGPNDVDKFFSGLMAPVKKMFGSSEATQNYSLRGADEDGEKVVVAILGMAHCNGIKKILMEGQS